MRMPTAAELLTAWELGAARPPLQQALALLASACPDATDEELWALSIGERDARLLEMRARMFGSALALVGSCPACAEQLESTIDIDDVRRVEPQAPHCSHVLQVGAHRVSFRLPCSADLACVMAQQTLDSKRDALLKRCIVEVRNVQGEMLDVDALLPQLGAPIVERMAQLDPRASVELEMTCPACRHRWNAPFDIAAFLWKEVHAWAQRTLRDVHRLARAYGWSEREALALSPIRRHIYLELCRR